FPLRSLELIINGAVVPKSVATNKAGELVLDEGVKLDRGGWLAVRCTSANNPSSGGVALGAHSNPIYVEMPGHPLDARADREGFPSPTPDRHFRSAPIRRLQAGPRSAQTFQERQGSRADDERVPVAGILRPTSWPGVDS